MFVCVYGMGGTGGIVWDSVGRLDHLPIILTTDTKSIRTLNPSFDPLMRRSDLKPANILLKSDPTDIRGYVAKVSEISPEACFACSAGNNTSPLSQVADFGLALRLEPGKTFISNIQHGTPAYQVGIWGGIEQAALV